VEKICDALRRGWYIETAAAYADISKVTLYEWMKKGNKEKSGPYAEFLKKIEIAAEQGEGKLCEQIESAADSDWRAAAWMLERKNAKRWGKKETIKLEDQHTKESNFDIGTVNQIIATELDQLEEKDRWDD
jgi:hypothetical protein